MTRSPNWTALHAYTLGLQVNLTTLQEVRGTGELCVCP